jgi:hypothetical protein
VIRIRCVLQFAVVVIQYGRATNPTNNLLVYKLKHCDRFK